MIVIRTIYIVSMLLASAYASASDYAREQRLANEIEDGILEGDPVYLVVSVAFAEEGKYSEFEFLNVYTESEKTKIKGAVIVLHGRGFHPDWEDVVYPLRVGLTEYGWNTLSMQMPVLEKQAKYYDYLPIMDESFPRIEAGIRYLQEQGNKRIILIAHSCSVHMTMAWFEQGGFEYVDAFVGIGMGATDYKQPMKTPFPLDKVSIPVLDVYGANEYPAVIRGASDRLKKMKQSGNVKSTQIVVPDADHYFHDRGEQLTEAVGEWLYAL